VKLCKSFPCFKAFENASGLDKLFYLPDILEKHSKFIKKSHTCSTVIFRNSPEMAFYGEKKTICGVGWVSLFGIGTRYGLMIRGLNLSGGEVFCTRSDRPWCLPSILNNKYQVFPGDRAAGRGVNHPHPPSTTKPDT
jgi:hypothetical protein